MLDSKFILIHMPHDYGRPKFYKVVKLEQLGTEFWSMIPVTTWHQTFVWRINLERLIIISLRMSSSFCGSFVYIIY